MTLVAGADYEIDELQGRRVILAKPLMQVARQRVPHLVRDSALDGNRVVLVVDYEYLPLGFADSAASFGFRGASGWAITSRSAVPGSMSHATRRTIASPVPT